MASPASSPSRSRSGEEDEPQTIWGWDSPTKEAAELDLDASLPHLRQVVLGVDAPVRNRVILFEDGATIEVKFHGRDSAGGLSAPLPFADCDEALFAVDHAMSMKFNHVFRRVELVSPYFAAAELQLNPPVLLLPPPAPPLTPRPSSLPSRPPSPTTPPSRAAHALSGARLRTHTRSRPPHSG